MNNSEIIMVNQLVKNFGKVKALDKISFTVKMGEIFGFLGPNGAGKTTAIRIMTGIITPDAGDALIDGINIQKNPFKAKMKMGVIPEMGNIYNDLSAKDNIILAGRFYGFSKKELDKRAEDLLSRFELIDRKDDLVSRFSKGMRQRVNISCALCHDPEILFLDEPTSGLDVHSQRLIKKIIKQMNSKGTTIFITTHNIDEANQLCDRIGVIHKGKIAAIDSPEKLKQTFDETRSIELSFNKQVDEKLFKQYSVVTKIEKIGDKWKLFTDDPDTLIKGLLKIEQDLKFVSLQICNASLEDAFIKLTGGKDDENKKIS